MKKKRIRRIAKQIVIERPGIDFWDLINETQNRMGAFITEKIFTRQIQKMTRWRKIRYTKPAQGKSINLYPVKGKAKTWERSSPPTA